MILTSITDESFLMSFLNRLLFTLWYLRRPPWDSGITPPELLDFLKDRPPGRAIDLGCGTGTNTITLARLGWQVTGIDFIPTAIQKARRKAAQSGVKVDLRVGDVTRLEGIDGWFDLAIDLGCFHSLSPQGRGAYLDQLYRLLRPGGTWFMYGFMSPNPNGREVGLTPRALEEIQSHLQLKSRKDGTDRRNRPSAYFIYEKRSEN